MKFSFPKLRLIEVVIADFDVLILGGGPAGSATALALRKHAPKLSVAIVEASLYESARIGEVLPAIAKTLLEHLGIRAAFEKENHLSVYSTVSAWGEAAAHENHSIFSTSGAGWHLDRRSFDAFLTCQAKLNGATIFLNSRLQTFEKSDGGWLVKLSDNAEKRTRFIVDATGRRAVFARKNGAAIETGDRLVSFSRFFTMGETRAPETLIESFPEGWWYTARAGARRVVTCLTDADIGVKLNLSAKENWFDLFYETREIRKSVGCGDATDEENLTRPANSARLVPVCDADWLAVGDAASAFDPLSSQGITKALRSAVFASYAIADLLVKRDQTAVSRYRKFIETEYCVYQKLYKKYYSNEQRWRDSLFWQRRHGANPN